MTYLTSKIKVSNLDILFLKDNISFFTGDSSRDMPWGALDDVVMGGVSESSFQILPSGSENGGPTGLFKGLLK